MASKYRLSLSRCSLVAGHANLFPGRFSCQFGFCGKNYNNIKSKKNGLLLRRVNCVSSYCLSSSDFSTWQPSPLRHSLLDHKSSEVLGKRTVAKSLEPLSHCTLVCTVGGYGTGIDGMFGCQRRGMAGHSHWQNIKHIKEAKDKEKSAVAIKVRKEIQIAIKQGGPDPKMNTKLARQVEIGIKSGVSKAKIMEMISSSSSKKSYQTMYCCATGPQGCHFITEVFTDNMNRLRKDLQLVLKKAGGMINTDAGRQAFDEKGVIVVPVTKEMEPVNMDKYLEVAIEVGAEDVILSEEDNGDKDEKNIVLKFHCDPLRVMSVKKQIESNDLEVTSAEVEFFPLNWVTLEGIELQVAEKIYKSLNEHEEVVKVFDNVTTPEE